MGDGKEQKALHQDSRLHQRMAQIAPNCGPLEIAYCGGLLSFPLQPTGMDQTEPVEYRGV